jgi:hypothetical protein
MKKQIGKRDGIDVLQCQMFFVVVLVFRDGLGDMCIIIVLFALLMHCMGWDHGVVMGNYNFKDMSVYVSRWECLAYSSCDF